MLSLLERISPRLADAFLLRYAYPAMLTEEAKFGEAPNNLFQHLEGYDAIRGEYSLQARDSSLYTWWQLHPGARWASLLLLGLACAWFSMGQFSRQGERKSPRRSSR